MKSGVFNEQLRMIWNNVIEPWAAPMYTITPLFYQGAIAGSEFLTYNVNKSYLCASCYFNPQFGIVGTFSPMIFYDLANAGFDYFSAATNAYNSTTLVRELNIISLEYKNLYFSRLVAGASYVTIKFIGYRINR